MHQVESEILTALTELDLTVKGWDRTKPRMDLQPLFSRLDELTRLLPRGTDPNLLHYLNKKSYEKARLLLLGCEAQNQRGTCDG